MAAARCPTPSPIGAVAPMVVASEGGDAAERISVSANENSTTTAIIMIGGRGTAPTPNKAAAARALLGLVGGIGAGAGGAATSTSTSTAAPHGEENVCNGQLQQQQLQLHSTTMSPPSAKRPREEMQQQQAGDDHNGSSSRVINTMAPSAEDGGGRPAKKHSPMQPERIMQKKNIENIIESKMDGQYGPGGGFIGPTMMEEEQQQPPPEAEQQEQVTTYQYQPRRHQWPDQADAIAAAAAQLGREEDMGTGTGGGGAGGAGIIDDRFHLLLGEDANEIPLRDDDGGDPALHSGTAATEEEQKDDDIPERMEVVRPVPFRVPEKVPRHSVVHQLLLQQNQPQPQLGEREDDHAQSQQLQQHRVQPSPITASHRYQIGRGLSSVPPLASSRCDGDEERRDDVIAEAGSPSWGADGDDAIERQMQQQRQEEEEGLSTVPRYGAGRAVVHPFGNSGVTTGSIGGYSGDYGGSGGGGGESYRGLSDNDAIFGDSEDEDLYHGSGSFDQDGNYYGPDVRPREEEKKDEDDPVNRPLAPQKLDSMFVSAGSQRPIGVDVPGMGFADSESLSSSCHIDLQARPHPKTKGRTGPKRKKVARKSQKAGICISYADREDIVARPRRIRQLRVSERKMKRILDCADFRRNNNITKIVGDVTAADIPAILTSVIDPVQGGRWSEGIFMYLDCRDLAHASRISKNFQFWVQRDTSSKVLDFKAKSSLAWEVVKDGDLVHSADDLVETKHLPLTMKCASSIKGADEKWGSIPTHMDLLEKVAGWCGGWLQFLYAREVGAKLQPNSPTVPKKTNLGVHAKKKGGGGLPQAAIIFDIHRNGKWVWSGIRPISKEYLNRSTDKTGLLRVYPFSERTMGASTDVDSPSLLDSTEAKRAGRFLISTAYDDRRTFTISASLVSEVSAETLIHKVSFTPRVVCRNLWSDGEFQSLTSDHWDVGGGKYWNERLIACSENGRYGSYPTECKMYVTDEHRLLSFSKKQNKMFKRGHIYFHNCFWLDKDTKTHFHMMTELVCEKELITEMFLNTHA